jgi:hypothetical protein
MLADVRVVPLAPGRVYNGVMPLDPITTAIINAIITSAVEQIAAMPPPASTAAVPLVGVPRVLPNGTAKGELVVSSPTTGQIDGRAVTLSPGVQIRDPYNMMVLPGMIRQPVPVRYLTDGAGFVNRVWILSGQEAAQP